ncbi:Crp/Fnr family transcriptional regulator [Streptomyces sp. NPDC020607]|uniref:Crp/Fnr family transcriptional regulator n=1 Tax=Streptomyces sp. NPDC020607 TaxID=3365082 RepID=UPI0037AB2B6F
MASVTGDMGSTGDTASTGDTDGSYDLKSNRILATLPQPARDRLRPHLEPVELVVGDVLYRPGERIDAVYFPVIGVCSIVTDLEGPTVEVATVGDEGMVGLPVFLGVATSTERTLCQVPGRALRMGADRFRHEIALLDGQLQQALQRFTQSMFTQLARNAACIRGHRTHQRCARWLLMTADRMHSERFELTQKFLAQMLAVRRSSVSEVAGALAADGCIEYSRGTITILDRDRLQAHACSCYHVIRDTLDAALPPHADTL